MEVLANNTGSPGGGISNRSARFTAPSPCATIGPTDAPVPGSCFYVLPCLTSGTLAPGSPGSGHRRFPGHHDHLRRDFAWCSGQINGRTWSLGYGFMPICLAEPCGQQSTRSLRAPCRRVSPFGTDPEDKAPAQGYPPTCLEHYPPWMHWDSPFRFNACHYARCREEGLSVEQIIRPTLSTVSAMRNAQLLPIWTYLWSFVRAGSDASLEPHATLSNGI